MANQNQPKTQPAKREWQEKPPRPSPLEDPVVSRQLELLRNFDPELALDILQILGGWPADKDPLPFDKAYGAARRARERKEILGLDFYVDPKLGNVDSAIGVAKDGVRAAGGEKPAEHFRPATPEERDSLHMDLGENDWTLVCELTFQSISVRWAATQKELIQQYGSLQEIPAEQRAFLSQMIFGPHYNGIGLWLEQDRYQKVWDEQIRRKVVPANPAARRLIELGPNETWQNKLQRRARRTAYRRIPGDRNPAAYFDKEALLDEAAEEGLDLGVGYEALAHFSYSRIEEIIEAARNRRRAQEAETALTSEEREQRAAARAQQAAARVHDTGEDPLDLDQPAPSPAPDPTSTVPQRVQVATAVAEPDPATRARPATIIGGFWTQERRAALTQWPLYQNASRPEVVDSVVICQVLGDLGYTRVDAPIHDEALAKLLAYAEAQAEEVAQVTTPAPEPVVPEPVIIPGRPWELADLRAALIGYAAGYDEEQASQEVWPAMKSALDALTSDADAQQKLAQEIFGVALVALNAAQAAAVLWWIAAKPDAEGALVPCAHALLEVKPFLPQPLLL